MPALNVNVGVLGHVDSGKTSLVAALSTTLSTAALDKHPQSRERGITLDLGFSSFSVPAPPRIQEAGYDTVQFTLVDCPGHASLIRTIIGGAQIIDLMILVVDATKGIQTQTAECVVIGELTASDMVVALNKIDQFPPEKRERYCRKAQKLVAGTLAATKFASCPIVPVAARPGSATSADQDHADSSALAGAWGAEQLTNTLLERVQPRSAAPNADGSHDAQQPFLFYVDHCFAIRGQGTVITGTVMRGSIGVGDTVELPELHVQKKVKSMQMFRQPVQVCHGGDRLGICLSQLDAKQMERGLACTPGTVPTFWAAVAAVEKIRFYAGEVRSRSKMHVTVGHTTVMAELLFFGLPHSSGDSAARNVRCHLSQLSLQHGSAAGESKAAGFDSSTEYMYQDFLLDDQGSSGTPEAPAQHGTDQQQQQQDAAQLGAALSQWVYLRFSQPVTAPADSLVIGSKLDADLHASTCRLAFHGRLSCTLDPDDEDLLRRRLRIYKLKRREGVIERIEADGCTAICRGMFQKETDLSHFIGMRVIAAPGSEEGRIDGSFGKAGKFRVHFPAGAPAMSQGQPGPQVVLTFKRFLFDDKNRRMVQS